MTKAEDKLRAHSAEFEKTVYTLSPQVYLAVGYAASNVGMIVGQDGLIIVDTTESTRAAENVLAAFRQITDKPVRTVIYTHSHRDHISGASVFAEGRHIEVIAHHGFDSDLVGLKAKPGPDKVLLARTVRQFGIGLAPGTERINIGLGPGDRPMDGLGQGHLLPNFPIRQDDTRLERCGVAMRMVFAPGECADTLAVFLPDSGVLFSADNFYTGFPNLYAIRGTPYRDFDTWADSLSTLRALKADILAPGHSRPIHGRDEVARRLADYEEAIRFVITKSAEGMNAGLTPDELVAYVHLPKHLADKPYLQEFYGTVEWAVRAYFAGTLGWFDGDPATLFRLRPEEEASRLADLAGGLTALKTAMTAALGAGDAQWALQLAGHVLRLDPGNTAAHTTKIAALRALAKDQSNACARNYYLSCAKQAEA